MIFIRADANEIIGSGHIMRSLSIANALKAKGEDVLFISADHRSDVLIRNAGYEVICMNSEYNLMESEIPSLLQLIDKVKPEYMLVDSYYVTDQYFKQLKPLTKVVYMDDLNSQVWDVDLLINYNIFSEVFDYSGYVNTRTTLLLSPLYAPLRKEFKNLPAHLIKQNVTDVMISAGGSDPKGISEQIIQNICPLLPNIKFHFVIGALNPRIEELKKAEKNNVVLHINEKNMSGLMKSCDIAVSAAGSTLYEICACGLPAITFIIADNQLAAAEQFDAQGIMINVGDFRGNSLFMSDLYEKIAMLMSNSELRKKNSVRMQALVDGNGADRIVEQLMKR